MHSYPGMIALVTAHYNCNNNIMAAGWHTYISIEPPIYGVAIGKERYTHSLVKESNSFAINFLPYEKAEIIMRVGSISGREQNKFEALGLPFDEGITISAPILKDAYIAYECKVIDQNTYGDHDWIVGEITECYRDDAKFLANGLPNFNEVSIPLYLGRSSFIKTDNEIAIETFTKK